MELFVIDRVNNDIVTIENLETMEMLTIKKHQVIGACDESNILIKNADQYVFSEEETIKRNNYINDLTKGLWN